MGFPFDALGNVLGGALGGIGAPIRLGWQNPYYDIFPNSQITALPSGWLSFTQPPRPVPSPDDFDLWCADQRDLTFEEWCAERFA